MNEENSNNTIHPDDDITSHDYDGIKELNNSAPTWIVLLFLGTILWAGLYFIHFFGHPNNNRDQISEYNQEMAEFELLKKEMQNANGGGAILNLDEMIAKGEKLYLEKGCIACHGMKGEGNPIGPNLADNYWINGCSDAEVAEVISAGRPTKGMTPYGNVMSEGQIEAVSTYILKKLVGSNPENAKEPQGEECK